MPSENGWEPARASASQCEWVRIPGTNVTLQLLKGQPLAILRAFAADFHAYVEPLRDADSAAYTPTNSVATSNHLNGTAMDLNWNSHPFKVLNAGFTPEQIAIIRELLAFYEGTVFWGNDWNSPKDAMHWNLGYNTYGNPKTADFIARKIRADGYSTFRRGSAPASAAPILAAATGLSEARAAEILPAVRSGLRESECTNVNRIAMWLAQIGHESGSFQYTEEIAKNGRYAPYIGRTWIQITWDYNYRSFSQWAYAFGMVPTPDYFVVNYRELADLKWAGIGPAWYWTVARPDINELSDRRDLNTVTRRINGGTNGLADRQARYNRALAQGDALLQLLHEEDDFLSALTDAEQRELLDLARQQAKYKRKSRSPLHWPHEGEVDTIAGLSWSTDANVHIQLVEKLAVIYGDPVSIALLYAVSNSDDPTNNPELAKRILKRVKPEDITAAQVQIQKWLAAEQKFHAA
ncbi:lysin A [Mycobacterium phage BillKnuckles]|uniref:Lysin A n=4 Tax=Viruses TaxID=10239 RepID=B5LLL2_9CAUD|nr:endolysin [Mycobacterium phage Solon]YP_009018237.1 endolysin [Mycobacterium phage BillKnuckles]YP_009210361.1 endolysin [Mycobacterium phage Nerujay]ACH62909.1 lysin A [Mycobacterium phage Solon]AER48301.1 lysin A [Mycobacterium phage BillKnuckles]AKF14774.1 lysin A [Mycobacterium phage Nerujay]